MGPKIKNGARYQHLRFPPCLAGAQVFVITYIITRPTTNAMPGSYRYLNGNMPPNAFIVPGVDGADTSFLCENVILGGCGK